MSPQAHWDTWAEDEPWYKWAEEDPQEEGPVQPASPQEEGPVQPATSAARSTSALTTATSTCDTWAEDKPWYKWAEDEPTGPRDPQEEGPQRKALRKAPPVPAVGAVPLGGGLPAVGAEAAALPLLPAVGAVPLLAAVGAEAAALPQPEVGAVPLLPAVGAETAAASTAAEIPPPPPPHPQGRRVGAPERRKSTLEPCRHPQCGNFREGWMCAYCALHCWIAKCTVHWDFPMRCLFAGEYCMNKHPEDCPVFECAKHCTAPNCKRHRDPPRKAEGAPRPVRTRGLRSNHHFKERRVGQ